MCAGAAAALSLLTSHARVQRRATCPVCAVDQAAVRTHFLLKRAHILKVVQGWLAEAEGSDTAGHFDALKKQVDALRSELRKLGPSPCDEYEEPEPVPEPPSASVDPEKVRGVQPVPLAASVPAAVGLRTVHAGMRGGGYARSQLQAHVCVAACFKVVVVHACG